MLIEDTFAGKDVLVRVVSRAGNLRGLACSTTNLVQEACRRHGTDPTASVCLARGLTGGALLGGQLKRGQRIAMRYEGNGALGKMLVEGDDTGGVRGYVGNPQAGAIELDPAAALGRAGLLTVVKDLGLKEPWSGTVHLVSGKIGEDLAYYLTESEQIPSAVGVSQYFDDHGVIAGAGGFLVQALPPSEEANIESVIHLIESLGSLGGFLKKHPSPLDLLHHLFAEVPYDVLGVSALEYRCTCSRQRLERALMGLGVKELEQLAAEGQTIETTCDFCHNAYYFTAQEIAGLLNELRPAKP